MRKSRVYSVTDVELLSSWGGIRKGSVEEVTLGLEGWGTCLSLEGTVEAKEGWEPSDEEGQSVGAHSQQSDSSTLGEYWNHLSSLHMTDAWAACPVTLV